MATHYRSRLAVLARLAVVVLVAVFAWPTFSSACCIGIEAATAQLTSGGDGCCPSKSGSDQDSEPEHNGACSCPLSCASGCTGVGRAVVATAACRVAPAASAMLARQHDAIANPLAPDPLDILHVPKRVAG